MHISTKLFASVHSLLFLALAAGGPNTTHQACPALAASATRLGCLLRAKILCRIGAHHDPVRLGSLASRGKPAGISVTQSAGASRARRHPTAPRTGQYKLSVTRALTTYIPKNSRFPMAGLKVTPISKFFRPRPFRFGWFPLVGRPPLPKAASPQTWLTPAWAMTPASPKLEPLRKMQSS